VPTASSCSLEVGGHAALCPPYIASANNKIKPARSDPVRTGKPINLRPKRGRLGGGGGEPPARAGNFLRRNVDMLFKTDQLPVAGAVGKRKPDLRARPIMRRWNAAYAEQTPAPNAAARHSRFLSSANRCPGPAAVVDRQTELETCVVHVKRVAGLADDGLDASCIMTATTLKRSASPTWTKWSSSVCGSSLMAPRKRL